MAFFGWLCITALAMSFCMVGLLALIGASDLSTASTPLLIGAIFALVSIYNQPF